MSEKAPKAITLPSKVSVGEEITLTGYEVSPARQGLYFCFEYYLDPTKIERSALAEVERVSEINIRFVVPPVPTNGVNVYRLLTRNDIGDRIFLGTATVDPE